MKAARIFGSANRPGSAGKRPSSAGKRPSSASNGPGSAGKRPGSAGRSHFGMQEKLMALRTTMAHSNPMEGLEGLMGDVSRLVGKDQTTDPNFTMIDHSNQKQVRPT